MKVRTEGRSPSGLQATSERRRYAASMIALPLGPLYVQSINFFGCTYGVMQDLLLFGNRNAFAPTVP